MNMEMRLLYCSSRNGSWHHVKCKNNMDNAQWLQCYTYWNTLRAHFCCRLRMMQSHARCHPVVERLQEQQLLAPLGVDEIAERCNTIVKVHKPNDTVCLCLDLMRLNQALIRPVHRGPTISVILQFVIDDLNRCKFR